MTDSLSRVIHNFRYRARVVREQACDLIRVVRLPDDETSPKQVSWLMSLAVLVILIVGLGKFEFKCSCNATSPDAVDIASMSKHAATNAEQVTSDLGYHIGSTVSARVLEVNGADFIHRNLVFTYCYVSHQRTHLASPL